jgi:hypothetical protein
MRLPSTQKTAPRDRTGARLQPGLRVVVTGNLALGAGLRDVTKQDGTDMKRGEMRSAKAEGSGIVIALDPDPGTDRPSAA